MAPVPREIPVFSTSKDDSTPAAVLILLFPDDDNWLFLLTERSSRVEYHQGQISLPGGAQEAEESLQQTALRETHEELGIDADSVALLGSLTPLFIAVSGFMVHPFVAWTDSEPNITRDSIEVDSVPLVSTHQLLEPKNILRERKTIRGTEVDVPFFDFGPARVWGATAMILSEFRQVLSETQLT